MVFLPWLYIFRILGVTSRLAEIILPLNCLVVEVFAIAVRLHLSIWLGLIIQIGQALNIIIRWLRLLPIPLSLQVLVVRVNFHDFLMQLIGTNLFGSFWSIWIDHETLSGWHIIRYFVEVGIDFAVSTHVVNTFVEVVRFAEQGDEYKVGFQSLGLLNSQVQSLGSINFIYANKNNCSFFDECLMLLHNFLVGLQMKITPIQPSYIQYYTMSFQIQKSEQNLEAKQQEQNVDEAGLKRKVIILSIFYFLVTVSLASFLNVIIYIHQKYRHKGYGQSYIIAYSSSGIVMSFLCPLIIDKMKNSKTLLIGCAMGYFINLVIPAILSATESKAQSHENMPPPSHFSFIMQLIANIIGGASTTLFWVIQGIYMTKYCLNVAQNQKGKYFSLANVILNTRIAVGPLLTMVGLGMGNETTYFGLLSIIILSAIPIGCYYIPGIDLADQSPKPLSNAQDNQLSQPSEQQHKSYNVFQYILSFFAYFKQVRLILPASIVSGLVVGFVASSLSHLLPKAPPGENNDTEIGIALLFFGLGNILGGHLSGLICDKWSIKIGGYAGSLFVIIGSVVQAICLSIQHTLGRSSFVGFLSGVSYSYVLSWVVIVCTIQFQGKVLSFATNKQITSFSYVCYQWTVGFLNTKCNMKLNMTYQGLALIPLALIAAYCNKLQCDSYDRSKAKEARVLSDSDGDAQTKEGNKQNEYLG